MVDKIVDTVPMKLTLSVTYQAPIWQDDSDDLDVIAREEKAELQTHIEGFVADRLGPHSNMLVTVEPVFEPNN